jgi:DcuC family C4-dicarboxylate transporter
MLIGALVATLTAGQQALGGARAFFEGAGYGFTHIISLIVTANAFGEGIKEIGLAKVLGEAIVAMPEVLIPVAGVLSLGFAALCGSGMATTQSFFQFFAEPALSAGIDPTHVGAVVSLASAAGRTLSPVAAVALMSAHMTGTSVFTISRRVAPPLLASTAAIIFAAMLLAPPP